MKKDQIKKLVSNGFANGLTRHAIIQEFKEDYWDRMLLEFGSGKDAAKFAAGKAKYPEDLRSWIEATKQRDPGFVHFPLSLLALEKGDKCQLLNLLINYALAEEATRRLKLERLPMPAHPPINGFNEGKKVHRAIASAMMYYNITGGEIESVYEARKRCRDFLDSLGEDHSPPFVRLPMGRVFEFRDSEQINELDFRVLCAVNACIGDKAYDLIQASHIRLRAVGIANRKEWRRKIPPLPTERQVRYSLEKLQAMGFFHRVVLRKKGTLICRAGAMSVSDLKAIGRKRREDARKARQERQQRGKAVQI